MAGNRQGHLLVVRWFLCQHCTTNQSPKQSPDQSPPGSVEARESPERARSRSADPEQTASELAFFHERQEKASDFDRALSHYTQAAAIAAAGGPVTARTSVRPLGRVNWLGMRGGRFYHLWDGGS